MGKSNKRRLLLILLAVFAMIAVLGYWLKNKPLSSTEEQQFGVENCTEIVGKVSMLDRKGNHLEVVLKNGIWYVNDSLEARELVVDNLLALLCNMEIQFPVSEAATNNVMKEFIDHGILVKVYNKKDKEIRSFYVGGTGPRNNGTNMIVEKHGKMAKNAYVLNIRGHEGPLNSIFKTDVKYWRSNVLFQIPFDNIKIIKNTYPAEPQNSFVINREGDHFFVQQNGLAAKAETSVARANEYASYFEKVYAEAFINEYDNIDTLKGKTPYCQLEVIDNNDKSTIVKIYHKPVTERTKMQMDNKGNPMPYDNDRYIAIVNKDKDIAVIQFVVWGKFFRKFADFLPEEPQE